MELVEGIRDLLVRTETGRDAWKKLIETEVSFSLILC